MSGCSEMTICKYGRWVRISRQTSGNFAFAMGLSGRIQTVRTESSSLASIPTWTDAKRHARLMILASCDGTSVGHHDSLFIALAWLALGGLCILASGMISAIGVFGLIDLLSFWSLHVSQLWHIAGALGLAVLLMSARVVEDCYASFVDDLG